MKASKSESTDRSTPREMISELLSNYRNPEDLLGEDGLLKQITRQLFEKALSLEMDEHLKAASSPGGSPGNSMNGHSQKILKTEFGDVTISVPRDKHGTFEPAVVRKKQNRLTRFDEKVMALYSRGMSPAEIQTHLAEIYGSDVSPTTIARITDTALDELKAWQARPLDRVYPIVYMDCLYVRMREGTTRTKAIYIAMGVTMTGEKEAIGIWIAPTEGAKFWLQVLTELRNRGVQDIFIACVDGLKGFPEAIETVFPQTAVQLCIVHLVRNSLGFVTWNKRSDVATDLKDVYSAPTAEEAERRLTEFEKRWDCDYPTIGQSWRRNWNHIVPFFDYPAEIRRVIYTTNAIESVNMSLRRVMRHRGAFQNDESLLKLIYLSLRSISKHWTRPVRNWSAALGRFAIQFDSRMP